MPIYLILGVIVAIILIFCSYRYGQNKAEMNLLQGFWESNSEFNKESGLQLFTFYIGDTCDGKYPAYLLMIEAGDEQTLLINEPTSFTISESYMNTLSRCECKEFYLRFSNLETSLIPNVVTMKFYPQTGKIVLSDHKKIYAVFFKNPVLSEMERIKNERELVNKNPISIKPPVVDIDEDIDEDIDDSDDT